MPGAGNPRYRLNTDINSLWSHFLWEAQNSRPLVALIGGEWKRRLARFLSAGIGSVEELGQVSNLEENGGYLLAEGDSVISPGSKEGREFFAFPLPVYEYLSSLFSQDSPPSIFQGVRTTGMTWSFDLHPLALRVSYVDTVSLVHLSRSVEVFSVVRELSPIDGEDRSLMVTFKPMTRPRIPGIGQAPQLERLSVALKPGVTWVQLGLSQYDIPSALEPNETEEQLVVITPIHLQPIAVSYANKGLYNSGNTCYMNSALQCLLHSPSFIRAVLSPEYQLAVSGSGVAGLAGTLAQNWLSFVRMYHCSGTQPLNPYPLRCSPELQGSQFAGNEQQDSFEFVSVFLDTLSLQTRYVYNVLPVPTAIPLITETPPTVQQLQYFTNLSERRIHAREYSVVTDVFQGETLITKYCPDCDRYMTSMEPFMSIEITCPEKPNQFVVAFTGVDTPPTSVFISLPKASTLADLLQILPKFMGTSINQIPWMCGRGSVVALSISGSSICCLDLSSSVGPDSRYKYFGNDDGPAVILVSITEEDTRKLLYNESLGLLTVFPFSSHYSYGDQLRNWAVMRCQLLPKPEGDSLLVPRDEIDSLVDAVVEIMDPLPQSAIEASPCAFEVDNHDTMALTTTEGEQCLPGLPRDHEYDTNLSPSREFRAPCTLQEQDNTQILPPKRVDITFEFYQIPPEGIRIRTGFNAPQLQQVGEFQLISGIATPLIELRPCLRWSSPPIPPVVLRGDASLYPRNPSVLSSIINSFSDNAFEGDEAPICRCCGERSRITRRDYLWKLPQSLIVQLKRFRVDSYGCYKLDTTVEVEESLDLAPVLSPNAPAQSTIYRLIGISHHYGSLGGGHYVADARDLGDNQWWTFNDTSATPKNSFQQSNSCYMMIYEKLDSSLPSSGIQQAKFRKQDYFALFHRFSANDD